MKFFIYLILIFFHCHKSLANLLNVLLIVVDDLRPNIGAYGDLDAVTPNIDQFARQGIIFQNAFAQQALCAPSRNSFLTSRRPDTLHLYDLHSYWRTFAGNFTTLPQYFKENSYYTKSIGKIFHPGSSSNFTDDYPFSWSEPAWHPSTEIYTNSAVCATEKGWFANLICPVNISQQPQKTLPDIQSAKEAIKFLKFAKKSDKPFFLAVGFHKPHIPFKFPEKFADFHPIENITLPGLHHYPPGLPFVAWNPWNDIRWREDISNLNVSFPFGSFSENWMKKIRQAYFASVSYVDSLVGELLRGLKASNLHKNTITVLVGDHGWSLGEHGEWSKYSNFDVSVRVPLIFRIPNVTYFLNESHLDNRPLQIDDPVELIDLFPTLVDSAGLNPLPECPKDSSEIELCTEGTSLLPLIKLQANLKGTDEEVIWPIPRRQYALSQYPRPGIYPTKFPNSDEPKLHQIKFMGYSIRTDRHRYTEWINWDWKTMKGNWSNSNQIEFYDHHVDPNENLNLSGRPGLEEVEKSLAELLRKAFGI